MPVKKRPKSIYAELYSGDRSSALAHLEHIELGNGARMNVRAIRQTSAPRENGVRRTDKDWKPVAP